MIEINENRYTLPCERRGQPYSEKDPLLPDEASYTPLLERMDMEDDNERT